MMVLLDILSWIALLAGSFFSIVGALGLLRMPDFWSRTHAAGVTDTMGALLILVGLAFQAGVSLVTAKLLMIAVVLYVVGPTAGHALFRAAHAYGIEFTPLTLGIVSPVEDERGVD